MSGNATSKNANRLMKDHHRLIALGSMKPKVSEEKDVEVSCKHRPADPK